MDKPFWVYFFLYNRLFMALLYRNFFKIFVCLHNYLFLSILAAIEVCISFAFYQEQQFLTIRESLMHTRVPFLPHMEQKSLSRYQLTINAPDSMAHLQLFAFKESHHATAAPRMAKTKEICFLIDRHAVDEPWKINT